VTKMKIDTHDPDVEFSRNRQEYLDRPLSTTQRLNTEKGRPTRVDRYPELLDFYNENDIFTVSNKDRNEYTEYIDNLTAPLDADQQWRRKVLAQAIEEDKNYYALEFSSPGGLVMPIILEISYADGSQEEMRIPVEIWRYSPSKVTKLLVREKEIASIVVDPHWETADIDLSNNHYPRSFIPARLELHKKKARVKEMPTRDLMQDIKTEHLSPGETVPTRTEDLE
jgi:hypothetical protein